MATQRALPSQMFKDQLFGALKAEQRDMLKRASVALAYEDGQTIYGKGTPATYLYIVLEGEVVLRLPGTEGVSLLIEQLGPGEIFGLNATFDLRSYGLTAQSVGSCKVARIETAVLQRLMDEDSQAAYALQKGISELYYQRFVATARRLQKIVTAMPLEPAKPRQSHWVVD